MVVRQGGRLRLRLFESMVGLVGLVLLAAAMPARAQSTPSGVESNLGFYTQPKYIGSAYCYACHFDLAQQFSDTKMGRLFQVRPQNPIERLGCEGCHGPGSNHATVGGGLGMGGLIEFRIDRDQPLRRANQVCLDCHDQALWHAKTGSAPEMACFDCHLVMSRMSRAAQLAPPFAPWNNWRNWLAIAAAGIAAGVFTGLAFRRGEKDGDGSA